MTKLSRKKLEPERMSECVNNLWAAFTLMQSKEQIRLLFKDLVTPTELKMFAKRLEVSRMLQEGNLYEAITKELHVTATMISKISNTLAEHGDGYRLAHQNLLDDTDRKLRVQRQKTKNLENPFLRKMHKKTLLGTVLKTGIKLADKKLSQHLKNRTAKNKLDL